MTEGRHNGGFKYRNRRDKSHRGRNSFWVTVITAIAGTVVKDLTSDDSKIKKLFNKVIHFKQIEDKEADQKKIIDAEYAVEDNENKKININGENE